MLNQLNMHNIKGSQLQEHKAFQSWNSLNLVSEKRRDLNLEWLGVFLGKSWEMLEYLSEQRWDNLLPLVRGKNDTPWREANVFLKMCNNSKCNDHIGIHDQN